MTKTILAAGGLAALICFSSFAFCADNADLLVHQALAAEARLDARTALVLFLKADAARPNDAFILEKVSKQYSDTTGDTTDKTEKRRRAERAVAYAQRAFELDPRSAVAVTALAISYGTLALCSDVRTEITDSRLVKKYAEQALALDPNCDLAYHVLGRWHCEVASLNPAKRFFAKLAYGGLPPASTAEAVRLLRHAVLLVPQFAAHHAELGFAYLANGEPGPARREFEAALRLPARERYDLDEKARVRAALAKLPQP